MTRLSMRSIFVSTSCISRVEEVISRISLYQNYGLNAIELGGGVLVDEKSLSQIPTLKCQFLVHNYFPPPTNSFVLNLASSDESIRQRSLDFVLNALLLTSKLDSPFYSVHAGFITDPVSFGTTSFVFPMPASSNEAQLAMERFVSTLKIALDYAENLNLQLLVENNVCTEELRGKLLLTTAEEFLELFCLLPSQYLGLLLDTGHLNVTAHTLGFDPVTFVDRVAPFVRAFHIHENDGMADTHRCVQHGSWVLNVLRRPEFASLPIVVEAKFDTVTDLRWHVNWLEDELERTI